jgi:DNA mismatch endonuclease (patch repair protein)
VAFWTKKIAANQARDRRTQESLRADGWSVLTIWECELKNIDLAKKRLDRFLVDSTSRRKLEVNDK